MHRKFTRYHYPASAAKPSGRRGSRRGSGGDEEAAGGVGA